MSLTLIIVLGAVALVFIAAVVLLIVLLRRRDEREFGDERRSQLESEDSYEAAEREQPSTEPSLPREREDREQPAQTEARGGTAMVEGERQGRDDETVVLSAKPEHLAYLAIKEGPRRGLLFRLPEKERIEIGRDQDNDIVLDDPEVSRRHIVVQWQEGNFALHDYVSKGGTFVNGERIESPHGLSEKDEVRVGNTVLVFLRVM